MVDKQGWRKQFFQQNAQNKRAAISSGGFLFDGFAVCHSAEQHGFNNENVKMRLERFL